MSEYILKVEGSVITFNGAEVKLNGVYGVLGDSVVDFKVTEAYKTLLGVVDKERIADYIGLVGGKDANSDGMYCIMYRADKRSKVLCLGVFSSLLRAKMAWVLTSQTLRYEDKSKEMSCMVCLANEDTEFVLSDKSFNFSSVYVGGLFFESGSGMIYGLSHRSFDGSGHLKKMVLYPVACLSVDEATEIVHDLYKIHISSDIPMVAVLDYWTNFVKYDIKNIERLDDGRRVVILGKNGIGVPRLC